MLARYQNQTGIEVAGSQCAHRHPGCWRETHACIDGFAMVDRRQTCAIAEMGEE